MKKTISRDDRTIENAYEDAAGNLTMAAPRTGNFGRVYTIM